VSQFAKFTTKVLAKRTGVSFWFELGKHDISLHISNGK